MILFFRANANKLYAVGSQHPLQTVDIQKLIWLLGGAAPITEKSITGFFVGPRKEMITPWSTNAVEITQNMEISVIQRIEEFSVVEDASAKHDRMLEVLYTKLDQDLFTIRHRPDPIIEIDNIAAYSEKEGLALSKEEITYLEGVSKQ